MSTTPLEFFDPTKAIGYTTDRRTQFAGAADLLAWMDAHGIARSLIYHSEARFYHPGPGNRLLLEALEQTPAAAGRLVPAAVIAPILRYDRRALPHLQQAMAGGAFRALRYFSSRANLRLVEPVIAELMQFRPVLFFDQQEPPAYEEIIGFAAQFPELPIVFLQAMWGHETHLADLMERCPNLHLDISWMHSDQTLEFMVRRFGAERVIFGAGPDSHNCAAIAALVHSELTDEQKSLVAHGNLQRLLFDNEPWHATGITPWASPRADKPLWNAYLRGQTLPIEIVDSHTHDNCAGMWLREENDPETAAARHLREMDRVGISLSCVAPIRALFGDTVADLIDTEKRLSEFPGRFVGYVVFNPFQAPEICAHFDDFFSRDFYIGFKVLNSYWRVAVTDPRFVPMWEYADAHRLPILLHTWIDPYDDPAMLTEIAATYPNAIFILGHSGGSDHASAIALAKANPNVYLEWCGSFCSAQRWEEVIAAVGNDRVLFGSDTVPHDIDWELGRMLSLDLADVELEPILGANMRAILARRI